MDAAPLLRLPGAPAPKVGAAEWFAGADGLRLRAALFPARTPIGSVVISGGRTEFIEKYLEVAVELVGRGYTVLIHDWRGQGLSTRLLPDRLKGHAAGYEAFVADHRALLDAFEERLPKPWIGLSHSMGGCLTAMALAQGETRYAGCIFSAPMWGIAGWPRTVAHGAASLMTALGRSGDYALKPTDPYAVAYDSERLTHDRTRYDRTRALILALRDLGLGAITWGWIKSSFDAIAWLRRAPEVTRIKTPLVVVAAGDEKIVDNRSIRQVAARVPGAKYVEAAGAYHEVLMETDAIRAVFWREFGALAAQVFSAVISPIA
ncbi:MAG: alpha/beta hydrolase [Caulobacteraceae bacterium]|nr:alpha/beta hydrolase [Caulobacteraceae bacterium]